MPEENGLPKPPFQLGKYRCEQYLASGGMAHVYKAWDDTLSRYVAIKILKAESEDKREEFLAEARLLSQCHCDNVVTIYEIVEPGGTQTAEVPFIVMELLEGDTLETVIRQNGLRDLNQILLIARQIANAMSSVHGKEVIHRDLKPSNLHVDPDGKIKLIDFGIAKRIDWNHTQAGFVKGTAYYIAPEQWRGGPTTFQVDVWAFGIVLFRLLANGRQPFQRDDPNALPYAVENSEPDYQILTDNLVPPKIQSIVVSCLEKDAASRYPGGFKQIRKDLDDVLGITTQTNTRTSTVAANENDIPTTILNQASTPAKSRLRSRIVFAVLAVLLVVAAVFARLIYKPALPPALKLDSGDMVLVPAGAALLGEDRHRVNLPAFYIDTTEVSNRAYAAFLAKSGHRRPPGFDESGPDYPVTNVNLDDAEAFAKSVGKRLPTAEEWEKAARGTNGLTFPWGDEPDPRRSNMIDNPDLPQGHSAMPVTSFPNGASPFGALNMCGNVWEWVDARTTPTDAILNELRDSLKLPLTPSDIYYEIRGGAFDVPFRNNNNIIIDFAPFPASYAHANIGFRCAMTPK